MPFGFERPISPTKSDDAPRIRPALLAYAGVAAFFVAFIVLAWNIDREGVAAPYLDPIAKLRTQDESLHINSAITMARGGSWLTPQVMGRFFLFKPPLLLWLSAASIRIFGLSLFSVRLPALFLGAAAVAAVFLWCAHARSFKAAVLAAGLLLLTPFWQIFSRVCLTDMPAAAFATLALTALAFDPLLQNRRTALAFGALGGASILAKSVAGVLPFAALAIYYVLSHRGSRPRLKGIALAAMVAVAVVSPWHLYQAWVHPHWFWADYVQVQLLGVGLRSQANTLFARSPLFYVTRLVQMDPVFAIFALAGVAGALRFSRLRNTPSALLAFCWTVVTVLALCAFQAKHLPYIVFLLPPLCILGALCGPAIFQRPPLLLPAIVVLFSVKAIASGEVWSLRPTAPPLAGAAAMRQYCNLRRDVELISVQPDDEFYSATLPLPAVRYCFLDPSGAIQHTIPHYAQLGIFLTAGEFVALPQLLPRFAATLREWGLNSTKPVGSAIVLRNPAEIGEIFRARPRSDFYLPSTWKAYLANVAGTHDVFPYSESRLFLLTRESKPRVQPVPAIPARW